MDIATLLFDSATIIAAIKAVDFTKAPYPTCDKYASLFWKLSESVPELADASRFLAFVCGWRLRHEQYDSPFETVFGEDLLSTTSWEAITDEQAKAVVTVTDEISDDELRARLSDFLWLRLRIHSHGRAAATAYISSVEKLIQVDWVGIGSRMSRGANLALSLGQSDLKKDVIERVHAIAERDELKNCTLEDCLVVLKNSRFVNSHRLYELSSGRAQLISRSDANPLWERRFWELAASFAALNKDKEKHRDALIEVARTFEREAEKSTKSFVAAHRWEQALQAYRRISGSDQDRVRVHRKLLEAQQGMSAEMFPFTSGPINISTLVLSAQRRIRGQSKAKAFAELIFASHWQPKSQIRASAEDTIRCYPLAHMFSMAQLSSTGKVAATAPGGTPTESGIPQERLAAAMCQQYKYFFPFATNGTIEPMRTEMLMAHSVSLRDIAEFVENSPRVPVGRGGFFTIGIHAGLYGRFIESLHVLIPQLENMLRSWFINKNLIASSINTAGIQREMNLNQLLEHPQAEALIGEDLCFVLRVLFTEKFGHNLRNEMAHGMLSPSSCFSDAAIYAWWLIMHLAISPIAAAVFEDERDSLAESGEASTHPTFAFHTAEEVAGRV